MAQGLNDAAVKCTHSSPQSDILPIPAISDFEIYDLNLENFWCVSKNLVNNVTYVSWLREKVVSSTFTLYKRKISHKYILALLSLWSLHIFNPLMHNVPNWSDTL